MRGRREEAGTFSQGMDESPKGLGMRGPANTRTFPNTIFFQFLSRGLALVNEYLVRATLQSELIFEANMK